MAATAPVSSQDAPAADGAVNSVLMAWSALPAEIQDDVYETYQSRDRPVIRPRTLDRVSATYLAHRPHIIKWVMDVGMSQYGLSALTCYLAVRYIDRVFTHRSVLSDEKRMAKMHRNREVIIVASLLLASKFNDLMCNIPSVDELYTTCGRSDKISKELILKWEAYLFTSVLRWDLNEVVTTTFMPYFLCDILVGFTDEIAVPNMPADADAAARDAEIDRARLEADRKMKKMCSLLCHVSMVDLGFSVYKPSMLAAAILPISRWAGCAALDPWPKELAVRTRYSWEQIHPLCCRLWERFCDPARRIPACEAPAWITPVEDKLSPDSLTTGLEQQQQQQQQQQPMFSPMRRLDFHATEEEEDEEEDGHQQQHTATTTTTTTPAAAAASARGVTFAQQEPVEMDDSCSSSRNILDGPSAKRMRRR